MNPSPFHDDWIEHQRRRWTRPDADRWIKPGWVPDAITGELKYNANQLRVPAGNPDGGQWTIDFEDVQSDRLRIFPSGIDDLSSFGTQVAANGHHYVPLGVFKKEKYSFSPEVLRVFNGEATGPLNDPSSNRYDNLHRQYNKAVEENVDRILVRDGLQGRDVTPDKARSIVNEIKRSRDPRIMDFNRRLWMREINYWIRRGPRGRE